MSSLSITTTLNQSTIPANDAARLVYALIEIRLDDMGTRAAPLPVNIGIVVDKSDSMCIPILAQEQFDELARLGMASETMVDGVPVWRFENVPSSYPINAPRSVDYVKRALQSALEQLQPRDQFALAAFAREAQLLVPRESGQNKRALQTAIDSLDGLQLGNETYMAAGMQIGLEQVRAGFSREMVNRMIVLTDGFTLDAPQCQFIAQNAAQAGIAISTLGLGVEFNEQLLISIADSSGGNAYFIRDPAEIPAVFAQELSGVQSVVLRNLLLKMRLTSGAELRRVHRVKPIIADLGARGVADQTFDLILGDLGSRSEIALLLEIAAPPRAEGEYQLAHFIVESDQPSAGLYADKRRENVVVRYAANGSAPTNARVMNVVEKVSAFKLQTRALDDAARGDVAGATQKLQAAATRLINMGEPELAQAAMREAANLAQRGQMSSAGTKRLRYETRRLTQKMVS